MIKRVPCIRGPLIKHLFGHERFFASPTRPRRMNKAENAAHSSVNVDRPVPIFLGPAAAIKRHREQEEVLRPWCVEGFPGALESWCCQVSVFSAMKEERRKKWSWAGRRSFQPGNGSVDGETQDGDHSGAQCHSQPEGGAAHIRAVQVSGKRETRVEDDCRLCKHSRRIINTYLAALQ